MPLFRYSDISIFRYFVIPIFRDVVLTKLSARQVDEVFFLKPFFVKPAAEVSLLHYVAEGVELSLQVASLETEYAIRHRVLLVLAVYVFLHYLHHIG